MDFNNIIDALAFSLMKFVNKLISLKSDSEFEEDEEGYDEKQEEEKESKFFDKITIFDELMKLELEMAPIKRFSEEKYKLFKEKYDEIENKAKEFYENESNLDTPGNQLRLSIGIDPLGDLEMLKLVKSLASDIKYYKENELNYATISKRLDNLNDILKTTYLRVLAKVDCDLISSANNAFERIVDDASKMQFASNEMKQEQICYKFCSAAYLLYKCNVMCQNTNDICMELYNKERLVIFSLFQKNVESLLDMLESFKDKKYYQMLKMYFIKLTSKESEDDFLKYEDFRQFVVNEKKVYELYLHYTNKQKKRISILDVKKYFCELLQKYPTNLRIQFFNLVIDSFEFDITYYELYKLFYIFGLKTFCQNYLNDEDLSEKDLIKEVFDENSEDLRFNSIDSNVYLKIYTATNEEELNKVSSKVEKLNLKYMLGSNSVYINKLYFEGCENILSNLETIEA